MAIDGLFILNISLKLNDVLKGARINKVLMLSNNEYLLDLYKPNLNNNLFISVNSKYSYVSLTNKKYTYSNDILHFHTILKKHIENFYIEEVAQVNFDRIIKFSLYGKNDIGLPISKYLYVELMGRYNNIILTKDDNTIIDSLYRLPFIEEGKRIILPGHIYSCPHIEQKKNPLTESFYNEDVALSKQFYGISIFCENIIYQNLKNYSFNEIIQNIVTSNQLYFNNQNFYLLPFEGHNTQESLFEGLTQYFSSIADTDRIKRKASDINRLINSYKKKLIIKQEKLENELKDSENAFIYKEYGELLFTYASHYKRGMNKIYIEEMETEIPLDSTKDLTTNANNYFKTYKKKITARKYLEEQLKIVKEEYEYFIDLERQINTDDLTVIDEIIEELKEQKYLKQTGKVKKKPTKIKLLEEKSENSIIYVGRNNLQNEYLTFKIAKPNDLFLHVKDYRGSHVVISNYQNDEKTLRKAAKLAVKYSSANLSSSVPVDYTKVKYVKKAPSSKPGKVLMTNYKTIYIDPDNN